MKSGKAQSIRVGIAGGGFQGQAVAFWFASRGFPTVIFDISPDKLRDIRQELANKKGKPLQEYLHLTDRLEDLRECDLFIENIPEDLDAKRDFFRQIEKVMKPEAILASNSSTFPPTLLSSRVDRKANFINIHYLGVSFGESVLELIPGSATSKETVQKVQDILTRAKFHPIVIRECPGFVYNRIKLAELSNLFRTVDMGLVSLEHALNYSLLPKRFRAPVAFIDFLGLDIEYASIRYLCSHYGERFYVSQMLEDKVKKKELGQKTGRGFLDHSRGLSIYDLIDRKPDRKYQSSIKTVYVNELQILHINLLIQLLNISKQVWFKSIETPFWELLGRINPSLFNRLAAQCYFSDQGVPARCDLVIDCPPLIEQDLLKERVAALQGRLRTRVPIILNIPLYKIEDIADKAKDATLIFGMNSMRSYLSSVELVQAKKVNPTVYKDLKEFVGELSGQCIEVADGPTRPLVFMQLAKMFETVRVLEEGIAKKRDIEKLLMTDSVFKDMDFFGLDNLVYLARSLYAIYGVPFVVPAGLKQMLQQGWLGVRVGKGFESYPQKCKK